MGPKRNKRGDAAREFATVAAGLAAPPANRIPAFFGPCSFRRAAKGASGASAVEFALVLPLFLLLIFGLICYVTIENTYIGTQELVSEAARASVAGISDTERSSIITSFINNNVGSYAFLDPKKVTVTSSTINTSPSTYQVNITYDMSGSFIYQFSNLIPLPSPTIQRTAVVLNGGA
jgi:Flp pilus assembly protein TadG